jgi:hypothetical protein
MILSKNIDFHPPLSFSFATGKTPFLSYQNFVYFGKLALAIESNMFKQKT